MKLHALRTVSDSFFMAIEAIRDNLLRSILTLLGIIIGVFAIIAVMTAIRTLENAINTGLNIFGSDIIWIQKMPAIRIGGHGSMRKYYQRPNITYEQARELREKLPDAQFVSAMDGRGGRTIKAGDEKTNPNVEVDGADEYGLESFNMTIADGRNIIVEDVRYRTRVAIVGVDVVEKLFPYADPLDKDISIDGIKFRVIGVAAERGEIFGQSQDNFVMIPLTTYLQYFSSNWTSLGISIKAPSREEFENIKEEATGQMRVVRDLKPHEENDFEVTSNDALVDTFAGFTGGVKIFAFGVSIIALVVAGIGIMNIMLVTVTERIKEIGIRKAIGATRANVLGQFLLEAVFLSLIGGIIGIILGVGAGNAISLIMDVEPQIPVDWVFIGLFVCSAVGITFGIYPAYKAAKLDPIESLRHE